MELNDDVLSIIFSLLGDVITLVTKKSRDLYFTKNGIWIHIDRGYKDTKSGKKFTFPPHFYRYVVNMDLKNIDKLRRSYSPIDRWDDTFINYFDVNFTNNSYNLVDYICDNTVFINYTRIESIVDFPKLQRVENVTSDISEKSIQILENTNIKGCILTARSVKTLEKNLDRIVKLDCKIQIPEVQYYENPYGKIPDIIKDKIVCSADTVLDMTKIYPNLEKIIIYQPDLFGEIYNRNNFPKIKKLVPFWEVKEEKWYIYENVPVYHDA